MPEKKQEVSRPCWQLEVKDFDGLMIANRDLEQPTGMLTELFGKRSRKRRAALESGFLRDQAVVNRSWRRVISACVKSVAVG